MNHIMEFIKVKITEKEDKKKKEVEQMLAQQITPSKWKRPVEPKPSSKRPIKSSLDCKFQEKLPSLVYTAVNEGDVRPATIPKEFTDCFSPTSISDCYDMIFDLLRVALENPSLVDGRVPPQLILSRAERLDYKVKKMSERNLRSSKRVSSDSLIKKKKTAVDPPLKKGVSKPLVKSGLDLVLDALGEVADNHGDLNRFQLEQKELADRLASAGLVLPRRSTKNQPSILTDSEPSKFTKHESLIESTSGTGTFTSHNGRKFVDRTVEQQMIGTSKPPGSTMRPLQIYVSEMLESSGEYTPTSPEISTPRRADSSSESDDDIESDDSDEKRKQSKASKVIGHITSCKSRNIKFSSKFRKKDIY